MGSGLFSPIGALHVPVCGDRMSTQYTLGIDALCRKINGNAIKNFAHRC